MKFKAWEARKHIEASYKSALRKLGNFLSDKILEDDTFDKVFKKLTHAQQSKPFNQWVQSLAKTFITNTLEENARTWRQAARKSSQGDMIRNSLENLMEDTHTGTRVKELVADNAKYIKTIPKDVTQDMTKYMQEQAFKGRRTAYRDADFKKMVGNMTEKHAKVIARTETSKAMSALTQARSEDIGLDWYIWHTSEDVRVRNSHKNMDNVLCRFSDPPAPEELVGEKSAGHYQAGNIYNCRCYSAPVVLWKNVSWPHRVYADGKISSMTKQQFKKTFGIEV